MTVLEIEYKTLLNQDEFNRLESRLAHVKPITQTNYYFDTSDFVLKAHRMSLRIRTFSDKAELTLKIPQEVGNVEHNQTLLLPEAKEAIKTAILPNGEIKTLLVQKGIPLEELLVLGHLTTIRRESQTSIGLLALDYNQYAGLKDYELELEVLDAEKGKIDFDNFLEQHNIDFKYAKSKVARFTSTLKKNDQ
ncbi:MULTISPECIES: CYTH domain-containing protein [Streptococcus]|uniref:CYTH domain-containing protein n=1 Tax=Streptococcus caledonicus TaxID=2614158 RepID=A0ABW0UE71_9STRE|nr:CYTH domain-containing protein [Streptococcus sp. S784/96/1]